MDQPKNKELLDETLTSSVSSEDSESWTLLGKEAEAANKELPEEASGVQVIESDERDDQPTPERRNVDSQLDESSDGISVISESDAASCEKLHDVDDVLAPTVHFQQKIDLTTPPEYEPLTPPYTPDAVRAPRDELYDNTLQVQQAVADQSLETIRSVVPATSPVSGASWVIFSVLATGMAAILLGNSMRLNSRVNEINFEHEKRISELELENNILKQEMSKLRHLYTRSELDEQVQQAEFEWMTKSAESDAEPEPEPVPAVPSQPVRIVPPQDAGIKRKVVWSGDEEEPMLIVDKDYVLPAFCYNQDRAVQDDLFFAYSAKYCDVKKRKVEAKQKKAEFQDKRNAKVENYNKFIHPKPEPSAPAAAASDPTKPASPFNIDYQKAFDAIKAEGSVIVEALGSILDLSPEPEEILSAKIATESNTPNGNLDKDGVIFTPDGQQHRPAKATTNGGPNTDQGPTKPGASAEDKQHRSEEFATQKQGGNDRKSGAESGQREHYTESRSDIGGDFSGDAKRKNGEHRTDGRRESEFERKQKHGHGRDYEGGEDYRKGKKNGHHKPSELNRKQHSDEHDDDDHHRKKFDQRRKDNRHDHREHHDHGSGKDHRKDNANRHDRRRKDSDEGSYLYKGEGSAHGKSQFHDDKRHKKHDEWHEKRYKGREEYRRNGGKRYEDERGSGEHWQERMKDGRQEAREEQRKKMKEQSNWYLERGNQREEERIVQQQPYV
ncbi:ABC transporter F family member 4-like [Anopheles cruzii]|uniref:ABC transporter F family member 4-like n=1 Tax=Anopheles cruzii TaxID=68878 RepID=UPI0022EC423B|nr:ABC transporter F family member 4-like [Anopheles cruzii]